MQTLGHTTTPCKPSRRNLPVPQAMLAALATLTLLSAAPHAAFSASGAPRADGITFAADGDETFVNDNGQTSGDIFQQNAQSQGPD